MPDYADFFRATLTASAILGAVVLVENPLFAEPAFRVEVALKKVGGTFVVPVQINGAITLDFTVDSGAADVSVPLDVFSTLTRTGTIKDSDIVGEKTYVLADGSKLQSATFTIRSLKVGDRVVENVRGSVAPARGSLLLGQSFLERFRSWSIDNAKHVLVLESGAPTPASVASPPPANVALPHPTTTTGEDPCVSFRKLADGTWITVKGITITHRGSNGPIHPGTIIAPGTLVAGADVYAALEKNCQ